MQQNCSLRAKIILEHLHTNLNKSVYCPEEITQRRFQTFNLHSSFIQFWQSGPIVSMNLTDYCKVPPFCPRPCCDWLAPRTAASVQIKKRTTNKTRRFVLMVNSGSALPCFLPLRVEETSGRNPGFARWCINTPKLSKQNETQAQRKRLVEPVD